MISLMKLKVPMLFPWALIAEDHEGKTVTYSEIDSISWKFE